MKFVFFILIVIVRLFSNETVIQTNKNMDTTLRSDNVIGSTKQVTKEALIYYEYEKKQVKPLYTRQYLTKIEKYENTQRSNDKNVTDFSKYVVVQATCTTDNDIKIITKIDYQINCVANGFTYLVDVTFVPDIANYILVGNINYIYTLNKVHYPTKINSIKSNNQSNLASEINTAQINQFVNAVKENSTILKAVTDSYFSTLKQSKTEEKQTIDKNDNIVTTKTNEAPTVSEYITEFLLTASLATVNSLFQSNKAIQISNFFTIKKGSKLSLIFDYKVL